MTTGEMLTFTKRLEDITQSNVSSEIVGQRLANLKSDIEEAFNLRETSHPVALLLHHTVLIELIERG